MSGGKNRLRRGGDPEQRPQYRSVTTEGGIAEHFLAGPEKKEQELPGEIKPSLKPEGGSRLISI